MQNFLSILDRKIKIRKFVFLDDQLKRHLIQNLPCPFFVRFSTIEKKDHKYQSQTSNKSSIFVRKKEIHQQETNTHTLQKKETPENDKPSQVSQQTKFIHLPNSITKIFENKLSQIQQEKKLPTLGLIYSDLEKYLNSLLSSVSIYKGLGVQEKIKAQNEMKILFKQVDYALLKLSVFNITTKNDDKEVDKIFKILFNFFSICYSQNLHSAELYNNLVKPFLNPNIIFQFHNAKRLPIAILYMKAYEKDYENSYLYKDLLGYVFESDNFSQILTNAAENDLLSILRTLQLNKLESQSKSRLFQEINNRLSNKSFKDIEVLKLFASLGEEKMFFGTNQEFLKWETRILQMNFEKLDQQTLSWIFKNLKEIYTNSKKIYTKILNFLTQNPALLTDNTLGYLLRNFDKINFPQYFIEFLNLQVKEKYKSGNFSISILLAFIYQLVRKKSLNIELFKELENYILHTGHDLRLSFIDLHHIFWSCHTLTFDDSPLFQKFENQMHVILKDPKLENDKFSILVWDISRANYLIKFEIFQTILNKLEEKLLSFKNDINSLATILHSISLFIAKYDTLDQNFGTLHKKNIQGEIFKISLLLKRFLEEHSLLKEEIETQAKIFQFLLTLKLEFPEAIENWTMANDLILHFETSSFSPRLTPSNLSIDVESVLKKMEVEYQIEKRVYIYFIDIFIQPNIALQIEGVRHYTKEERAERHQDLLRNYHLKKLGFKFVKVPFYEFSKIFFTDIKKQKEYLHNIIYST